jgi:hypothetical protein
MANAATSRFDIDSKLAVNAPGYAMSPGYLFPTSVTRKHVKYMFKFIVPEKRSDTALMRVSACLFAREDPGLGISFCDIGNMSKYKTEFPSADSMNGAKTAMTSFSLPTSRRFNAAMASVSRLSFNKLTPAFSVS